MNKKVIIIGGGMAGLSAGCYLRMNGVQTEIFEMHNSPGGVCTSWSKGDYTVDLCVHWLVGSGPADNFYDRWNELIDMERIDFVDHEEYMRVEDKSGKQIIIYTNLDQLEEELLNKAPEDEKEIAHFISGIRRLANLNMPNDKALELSNLWDKTRMLWKILPYMGLFGKYMHLPAREYAKRFSNPLLRKAIEKMFEPEMAVIFQMMTLAWMHKKSAGYPVGGSLRFSGRVFQRYRKLGGHIHFQKRVAEILVERDRAIGIRLTDGTEHFADYVISAADGHSTLFGMLKGEYLNPDILKWYTQMPTFPSLVFVALGIDQSFTGDPHNLIFPLKEPIRIDPKTVIEDLPLRILNFDPTLAPPGKTLATLMLETTAVDYWNDLFNDNLSLYHQEKNRISDAIIEALDNRIAGIREKIEMVDVATPATFFRFTGNWKGSFEGWLLTPEAGFKTLGHQLPKLDHFYMCGHWVEVGGGLPTVLRSGRTVAELICHAEGKPFQIIEPYRQSQPEDSPSYS